MKRKAYQLAQELEERIFHLQLLKKYMELFFEKAPFRVEVRTSILGVESLTVFPFINGNLETEKNQLINKSDKLFIINQIQSRINDLQKQFEII